MSLSGMLRTQRFDDYRFQFMLASVNRPVLQIRGRWNHSVDVSRKHEMLRLCNDWNMGRVWPKVYVRRENEGMLGLYGEVTHDFYGGGTDQQIDRAIGTIDYRLFEKDENLLKKGKKISAKKARSLLGTEEFLSGVGRSAFHWDAIRDVLDGRKIYFEKLESELQEEYKLVREEKTEDKDLEDPEADDIERE